MQDNLAKADRERKCLRRAMFLMVTLFLLSLAGLGVCALWLPHVFSDPTAFATNSLIILGLASLISQIEFFGYLLWHRVSVNRLHKECRLRVLLLVESRLRSSSSRSPGADRGQEPSVGSVAEHWGDSEEPKSSPPRMGPDRKGYSPRT